MGPAVAKREGRGRGVLDYARVFVCGIHVFTEILKGNVMLGNTASDWKGPHLSQVLYFHQVLGSRSEGFAGTGEGGCPGEGGRECKAIVSP